MTPLVPKPPPMPDEQESGAAPAASPSGVASPFEPIEAVQAATEEREPHGEPAPVPDPSEVEVPRALAQEIRRAIKRYPRKRSAAIPALWAVQRRYGWCTPEGIRQAAAVMGVTPGYLQSVASFYDLFRLEPQGEHQVLVCTNISCWLRGADRLLEAFKQAADGDRVASAGAPEPGAPDHPRARANAGREGGADVPDDVFVRGFECLGACDIAPMASIDERYYGPLADEDAVAAIEQLRSGKEVLPEKRLEDRGAAGGPRGSGDKRIARHPVNRGTRPKPRRKPAGGTAPKPKPETKRGRR